ncbi:MAG: hypothetical protein ABIR70_04545 [Bryobacteraceae bacterium]
MLRTASICRSFLLTFCCGLASAQSQLSNLEVAAKNTQQQWFSLASTLDARLSRMAPCNVAATAAIDDAQKASGARIASLIAFTQAVADQAATDVAMARQIQRSEEAYALAQKSEFADVEQERAGIAGQATNLAESVRKRVSLTVASDELRGLEASVRERAGLVAANITAGEKAAGSFAALVQALEKREAAVRKQLALLDDERTKWNGYYSARLARTMVECEGTGR